MAEAVVGKAGTAVKVVCVGITTLDRVWMVESLPATGGKYRASDYLELGGGMAANAAVAVARLGGQVQYWGRAGDDTAGRTMREELLRFGVDVAQLRLFTGAHSSVSAILVARDGERTIVNFRGSDLPADADWVETAGIAQAQAVHADVRWVDGASKAYRAAREHGIPTVLDGEIADPEVFATLLPLVDHAIFSEPGLRSFHGKPADTDDDLNAVLGLQAARDLGCRVAAVTRGARGTLWLDDHGVHFIPSFSVSVTDTTGAGDVFHGAYAWSIGGGHDVAQAMRTASAVAALKCTRKGARAGIPDGAELEAFLAAHPG